MLQNRQPGKGSCVIGPTYSSLHEIGHVGCHLISSSYVRYQMVALKCVTSIDECELFKIMGGSSIGAR